jgi:hypothetical protein
MVGIVRGFIRGPVSFQVDTWEVWFIIIGCRVILVIAFIGIVGSIRQVFVFIELIDVAEFVVFVTPIIWVVVVF